MSQIEKLYQLPARSQGCRMNNVRLLGKLLGNALRYRYLHLTGRPASLEAISLEVTHRCICRCRMCNIWQIPADVKDLPLSAWTDLLSSPELHGLRELDITGGEPFLRDDLRDLLKWVGRSKSEFFPHLRTVAVTTNGILTERILDVVADIIAPLREQGIELVLACGMDAVGELHDQIRNLKNAWTKLETTLIGLEQLRDSHPNLILGVKTTIIPANVTELDRIAEFAREHQLFTIISPCIITANRFGNMALKEDLRFSCSEIEAIKNFYSGPAFQWNGHRLAMLHYLSTGKVNKPCSAGYNTVFVRHTGDVFPCPLIPNSLGNIKNATMKSLLSGPTATAFRRRIRTFPECRTCTEPGLERLAWPFEGTTCLRELSRLGFSKFDKLSRHMGLDKYLS
ncbi:MAG: radical SAM protein [Desulfuromonadales bacterium]|nr:radical SAM protein [Desulfuromonadales bacterium]